MLITGGTNLNLGGNFNNNGGSLVSDGGITFTGSGNQSIDGFTTTGFVRMSNSTAMITLKGNINGGILAMNTAGGTLNLGNNLTHTFTGNWINTASTLEGGSSILKIKGNLAGSGGTIFNANTGTVEYYGTNQNLVAGTIVYNNLILSGSGTKTITNVTTVNNVLSMEGTAFASGTPSFGPLATLIYNSSISHTAGDEWASPFTGSGGVIISNTGTITRYSYTSVSISFNENIPLTIKGGASLLITGNPNLALGGNFINEGGSLITNGLVYFIGSVNQDIAGGVTLTGPLGNNAIVMNKRGGTATFTGNINVPLLYINGTGGTLNLGTGLIHTISGNWFRVNGAVNGGTSLLRIGGDINGTGGAFIPNTGTVEFNGTNQNLGTAALTYNNLILSGSGTKFFGATTTMNNTLSIATGVITNLNTNLIHTAAKLSLGETGTASGSWGSTASSAMNKDNTFFTINNGILNVGMSSCIDFVTVAQITYVAFNTLNKVSSGTTSYEDFTADTPTDVNQAESYILVIKGSTNGNNTSFYTAFFDWNNDGDFDDLGGYFEIGTIINSTGTDGQQASFSIPIPIDAAVGNIKMRIIGRLGGYNTTPCTINSSTGQVEDYTINIKASCVGTPTPGVTIASIGLDCTGTPFTLSLQNTTTGGGVTYQWQTSLDNITWSNVIAAISSTYTTSQTVTTYYQCLVTCKGSTGISTFVLVSSDPIIPILGDINGECSITPPFPVTLDACGNTITGITSTVFPVTTAGTTEVTWTFIDNNGNASMTKQNIIIADTTPPVFVGVLPSNTTIECSVVIPVAPIITAVDNCSTVTVLFNETTINGSCSGDYQLHRTWIATDTSGNEAIYMQIINVQDTMAPVFVEPLPEALVNADCDSVPIVATLTATDSCGTATVDYTETKEDGNCSSNYTINRTWVASDNCGNQKSYTQTIKVTCLANVYNGISPNGDGKNDTFIIGGIDCYPNNSVRIFNRYGVVVYEKEGYDNVTNVFEGFSDGRNTLKREEKLPTGTYFYTLQYDNNGNKVEKSGYLYISTE
ncbi:gliding motility-associated C-terminal domain-containing protein [Flavobacterium sp. LS1R49]|uniref:Gliding motility-associated C-terminal domain-containing protein n=1 Tax=Flavobacterium shii TaxID=2987687 RepID=A0A9X2ZGE9_9FLAO|nr:gliding motility-associated C-terminal domain-containing protein [Flavobacterium shii]MCV9930624.1 gliding motility-associated C-terminal domain-containing protein [Flavobacterium shii]